MRRPIPNQSTIQFTLNARRLQHGWLIDRSNSCHSRHSRLSVFIFCQFLSIFFGLKCVTFRYGKLLLYYQLCLLCMTIDALLILKNIFTDSKVTKFLGYGVFSFFSFFLHRHRQHAWSSSTICSVWSGLPFDRHHVCIELRLLPVWARCGCVKRVLEIHV